ncbi:hypothetical protein LWI29_002628 [Acer saccharum]|uniref:phosphoenolpyruvate carboxykinase (ATP) n=1 Tax=Acer saccharum TaxID=4024 RepID=A0AA39VUJ4_ACESA|nr:hypothetical protein LWI29_002628 [Acer saccharum]
MRSLVFKRFIETSLSRSTLPLFLSSRRGGSGFSDGLNWALARKGVVVKDNAFQNLTSSELQQKGATIAGSLSGLPLHVRGNVLRGSSDISKAQYIKLLKQVTTHMSSIPNVFVHDGAVGSSSDSDAKVRVISDSPSAVLKLSSVLWRTPTRAVSHDSCPLTLYVATSISPGVVDAIGLVAQGNNGFIAADIERSSLVLYGKAFSDANGIKEALTSLSGPIISARGGLLLSARVLVSGDSVILLFAPEDTIQSCADQLVSADAGVVLSSQGVAPLFPTGNSNSPNLFKLPAAVILASSDRSGIIPSIAKLSPGQAAYHFLAGYQNGKFVPAYSKFPSMDALELAKAFYAKMKDHKISTFIVNVNEGRTHIKGKDLLALVESSVSKNIPPFEPKGGRDLEEKYRSFLSGKYPDISQEFSF